jgi:DNA modification methylase
MTMPPNLPLDEVAANKKEGGAFRNPAFASNKVTPIHRWVPWIAGFSSQFVKNAIGRYLTSPGTVLDPFSGVGTTLVDAVLSGHNTIGFEINPYPALASRVKANAFKVSLPSLEKEYSRFEKFYSSKVSNGYTPISRPPEGFKTRSPFYSPKVLRKVLITQDSLSRIQDPLVRDIFRLAFASTMVTYSNYSYEPSLGRRVSAGKDDIEDFAVGEKIAAKLIEMLEDLAWLKQNLKRRPKFARVVNDSFFNCQKYIERGSVDLAITSPPYLNNYHYNRNTRPQLYWLGFVTAPSEMQPLEEANFGKYWQTVRERARVNLEFDLPHSDLALTLEQIARLNPEKGIYGGQGWANYAASYFNDCYKLSRGLKHALKKDGTALVVVGNSILQGVHVATDRYLGEIADLAGLKLVEIHIPRATRVGNSIIQSGLRIPTEKSSHQLYEAVVELRR